MKNLAGVLLAAGVIAGLAGCSDVSSGIVQSEQEMTEFSENAESSAPDTMTDSESAQPEKPERYQASYFRSILQDVLVRGMSAEKYTDPVSAAVEFLQLEPGKGELIGEAAEPEEGRSAWEQDLNPEVLREGTKVTVSYTFDKDGTTIEIPMELVEMSLGLWAPAEGNYKRQVYNTYTYWDYLDHGESRVDYELQFSNFGLYKLEDGAITCIYPYYVAEDTPMTTVIYGTVTNQISRVVYFVTDSTHQDDSYTFQPDCIAMLDMDTRQVDKESIKLKRSMFLPMPQQLYCENTGFFYFVSGKKEIRVPIVNVGTPYFSGGLCWEGKPIAALNEQEQNAYGSALREELLAAPGTVYEVSKRTMTETYAYVDLDGDGISEKIVLAPGESQSHSYLPYDSYTLSIGESVLEDSGEALHNDLYVVSLDGKEILHFLLEDGPSADPASILYAYREGKLVKVGEMPGHIEDGDVQNGLIYSTKRGDVLQTDYINVCWCIDEAGYLQMVPRESYDYQSLNDIELLVTLPVHQEPNLESQRYEIQPGMVRFLKTDATFHWVYVKGEDGTAGWVYADRIGEITELDMSAYDVFNGLNAAG